MSKEKIIIEKICRNTNCNKLYFPNSNYQKYCSIECKQYIKKCYDLSRLKLCNNPKNNNKCKGIYTHRSSKSLCISCTKLNNTYKLGKETASRIVYKYPCCGKIKTMTKVSFDRAIIEDRICKSCHLIKMRNNIPIPTNETKLKTSISLQNATWNFTDEELVERSNRMKGDNNPAKRSDVKRKLRIAHQKQINNLSDSFIGTVMYNPNSIPIIEQYGIENGYNFQHAENGGEFQILGYWLDGYDKEKNVAIEYDEKHHFTKNNLYSEKDIYRQNEIQSYLKCKFIRIDYVGNIKIFKYEN